MDADHGVDARREVVERLPVAVGQAAGHHHTAGPTEPFVPQGLANDRHRFLPRRRQEAAGVDNDDVGLLHRRADDAAGLGEDGQHPLAVDEILRAPQRYQGHRGLLCHTFIHADIILAAPDGPKRIDAHRRCCPIGYTPGMTVSLKPLTIGDLQIGLPVVLAPLAGYTDLPYRLLCRQQGADYCATEMMLDRLVVHRGKAKARFTKLTPQDHPIAGQITGNEPDVMAQAAAELCQLGFDTVDLNFACPVRKALSRRRGGWLMNDPARAVAIVTAVTAACSRPVTVKLRQQFRRSGEPENFWAIAEGAFTAGAAAIAVHARSVEARYSGPADWDFLAEVKRRFPDRTILGSGDVLTPHAALDMIARTGVDGVLAARGALGNPWFFRQVRDLAAGRPATEPTLAEQRRVMLEHLAGAVDLYGPMRAAKILRGFGVRYARRHVHAKALRMAFVSVKTADQWRAVVEEYFPDNGLLPAGSPPCVSTV